MFNFEGNQVAATNTILNTSEVGTIRYQNLGFHLHFLLWNNTSFKNIDIVNDTSFRSYFNVQFVQTDYEEKSGGNYTFNIHK